MSRVFVAEDDLVYRDALARAFQRAGHETRVAGSVAEAEARLSGWLPDLAVVDLKLPDGSGIDVLRLMRKSAPKCRAVLLTAHGTIPATVEAMRAGAVDVLTKPVSSAELLAALEDPGSDAGEATLDDVERDHILRTLEACGGNVTRAAERLGLHRRTLQRKMNKLPQR